MTEPELSVVVASVNGFPYLGDCLDSLRDRSPGAEVIVADSTDGETRRRIRERWPAVQLLSFDVPRTVPELRAAGIAAAHAPYVAVIEDHCVVRNGWAQAIVAAHKAGNPVVGGGIRNAADKRLRDWAAFFCEYSAFMTPLPEGPTRSLTGMNVSYDRRALREIDDLLEQGVWEGWLHDRLRSRGFQLYADSAVVLDHAKDFGFMEFLSQRYHYSRSYAGMRNEVLGRRRWLYLLGSPALVPVLWARILRNVLRRRRHRRELLLSMPLIILYTVVWSFGEAVGYAFGGGRSLLKVR